MHLQERLSVNMPELYVKQDDALRGHKAILLRSL
jgi:hypothetical protein